jgi:pimeloyl-ACP methyl ester carboxylesterase
MPELTVTGRTIQVFTIGDGEPVVLLHGGGLAAAMWKPLMMKLRESHFLVAPDLPPNNATAVHLEVIEAAMALAPGPVHLVGHSYGGGLALRVALRRPERLASLVLVEPTLPALLRAAGEIAAVNDLVSWRNQLDRSDPMAAAKSFMDVWGGPDFWRWLPPSSREGAAAWIAGSKGAGWDDFYETETIDLAPVASLSVPTLILCGDISPPSAQRTCEVAARTIPGASYRVLSGGVGHMSPITHSQLVIPEIAAHLRAHPIRHAAET